MIIGVDDDDLMAVGPVALLAACNTIEPASLTDQSSAGVPWDQATFRSTERLTWLHNWLRLHRKSQPIELWPALLTTSATISRVTLGPYGEADIPLGHFLRAAHDLRVANVYARYVNPPRAESTTLGDGLVAQFVYGGVLHIWAGARLEPDSAPASSTQSHPNREQQEVIDHIVGQLVADPDYRALVRKSDRDNYAREHAELAEAVRGEHPVLPPNFVYRVLQAAAGKVDHEARAAYADIEVDLPGLVDELDSDSRYLLIADKTARRHYLRAMLFDRYNQYAPPPSLVARLLDATNHTRPIPPSRKGQW